MRGTTYVHASFQQIDVAISQKLSNPSDNWTDKMLMWDSEGTQANSGMKSKAYVFPKRSVLNIP